MCASFAVTPRTAKVMATVPGKCLVRMEEALNLQVGDLHGKRVWLTAMLCARKNRASTKRFSKGPPEPGATLTSFLTVYYYNCSILLLAIVNLFTAPDLETTLSHRQVCIERNNICRVRYYLWFRASTGGLRMYLPWMGGGGGYRTS